MNPSKEAVENILSQKVDWSQDNIAIAESLNTPSVGNPEEAPLIPAATGARSLIDLLSPESRVKVLNAVSMPEVRRDILAGNILALLEWPQTLFDAGLITESEQRALEGALTPSIPDPRHPTKVGWAVANLGRPVDAEDVHEARMAAEKAQARADDVTAETEAAG